MQLTIPKHPIQIYRHRVNWNWRVSENIIFKAPQCNWEEAKYPSEIMEMGLSENIRRRRFRIERIISFG